MTTDVGLDLTMEDKENDQNQPLSPKHSTTPMSIPTPRSRASPMANLDVKFQSMGLGLHGRDAPVSHMASSNYPSYYNTAYYDTSYSLAMNYPYIQPFLPHYPLHPLGCACHHCLRWNMHYSHLMSGGYSYANESPKVHQCPKDIASIAPRPTLQHSVQVQTDITDLVSPATRDWKRDDEVKPKGDTAYCKDARKVEDLLLVVSGGEESHAIAVLCKILERNDSIRNHIIQNLKCHRLDTMIVDGLALFIKDRISDDSSASSQAQVDIETLTTASFLTAEKRSKYGQVADRLFVPVKIAKKCKQRAIEMRERPEVSEER